MRTVAGTPGYTALEVLGLTEDDSSDDSDVSDTSRRSYSSKVDIWAVGAIAFVSLTGELPFPARNSKALRKYVNGKAPFPSSNLETKSVSALACRQLEEFMAPDPMRRPGAEKALHTAWLKNTLQPSHPHLAVNSSEVPRAEPESFSASGRWTDAGDSGYQTTIQQDARKIAPFADDDSGYMYHTIVPQRLRNVVSDAPTCPWRLVQQVKDLPRFDSGQVKFGEDSSYLALFSEHSRSPGSLLLWNAASNEIKTRDFPKSKAQWREQQYAVTQTPSGIRVFASDLRGSIKVFRVLESVLEEETKMLAEQIPASVKGWASVAFSSDGRFAMRLSFRSDGLIGKTSDQPKAVGTFENWDLATGKRLHHFQLPRELTYEGSIAHWTPSPDGRLVAFYKFPRVKSSSPRVLIVLDVSKGSVQALVLEHTVMREIDFLAFSPDVSLLAAPFRTREIIIWKIDTLSRHSFKPKPIRVITCRALLEASCYFEFTPDGERIVVQVSDGSQPDFYDVRTGEQTSETLPLVPAGRRGSFRFSPDGLLLAMLTWESTRRESPTETLALYRRDP